MEDHKFHMSLVRETASLGVVFFTTLFACSFALGVAVTFVALSTLGDGAFGPPGCKLYWVDLYFQVRLLTTALAMLGGGLMWMKLDVYWLVSDGWIPRCAKYGATCYPRKQYPQIYVSCEHGLAVRTVPLGRYVICTQYRARRSGTCICCGAFQENVEVSRYPYARKAYQIEGRECRCRTHPTAPNCDCQYPVCQNCAGYWVAKKRTVIRAAQRDTL